MAMDKRNELSEAIQRGIKPQGLSDNLQSRADELVKAEPVPSCLRARTIHVISEGPEAYNVNHTTIQENARVVWGNSERIKLEYPETNEITIIDEEREGVLVPHHDALIISGSSSNIIFQTAYQGLGLEEKAPIRKAISLVRFSREVKETTGEVVLPVHAEEVSLSTRLLVVSCHSPYNVILGRAWIPGMGAVPSTLHQTIKFPTPWGVRGIRGDQETTHRCYQVALKKQIEAAPPPQIKSQVPHTEEPEVKDMDDVPLVEGISTRNLKIGSKLPEGLRRRLVDFLRSNSDCFAWSHSDMPGIDPEIIMHQLQVDPSHQPTRQKRRKFAPERDIIINEEVRNLLEAKFIREVQYPEWLANVVVVKKKNGKWRVCIDLTDLNKSCRKDPFPLPHIDKLVDAMAGHQLMSFMDAFSGYNQILMKPEDQEKTSFMTSQGIYCYKVMPFGLKNAGSTYQRLVNMMFTDQIGETMEVYIDDMLVKSLEAENHISHLQQAFSTLRKYNMKLNPAKCSFGDSSGKFLGYIVTHRGIEANPDQIRAIHSIPSPRSVKEVQKLTGRMAALSRFISRLSDKSHTFFETLKRPKDFEWTEKCESALQEFKDYLTTPLLLSKPLLGEVLLLYLTVSEHAVSAVLVREEETK
ncbi:uncharacterized protein LOC111206141 [Brassica napus]|uniref:uncharacterized protein LOC111206141 n=1 Tax=Brassica napus TaxID=3708 RepID=UPI000BBEDC59|nr:uncharacterized protein LOC111206141 [Brassica napus]